MGSPPDARGRLGGAPTGLGRAAARLESAGLDQQLGRPTPHPERTTTLRRSPPLNEAAPPGRKGAGLELSPFAGAADAALHAPQEQAPGAWAHAARTSSLYVSSCRSVRVA